MVGTQVAHQDPRQQQADGIAEAELYLAEHQGDGADEQAQHEEGGKGHQIRGLAVDADEAYLVGQQLDPLLLAADLQHVALCSMMLRSNGISIWERTTRLREASLLGEVELHQMATHHGIILHHDLFGDDLQVKEVAIEHLLAVAVVDVELLVALGVAHQGDLVPFLNDGVTIGLARMPLRRMRST